MSLCDQFFPLLNLNPREVSLSGRACNSDIGNSDFDFSVCVKLSVLLLLFWFVCCCCFGGKGGGGQGGMFPSPLSLTFTHFLFFVNIFISGSDGRTSPFLAFIAEFIIALK